MIQNCQKHHVDTRSNIRFFLLLLFTFSLQFFLATIRNITYFSIYLRLLKPFFFDCILEMIKIAFFSSSISCDSGYLLKCQVHLSLFRLFFEWNVKSRGKKWKDHLRHRKRLDGIQKFMVMSIWSKKSIFS